MNDLTDRLAIFQCRCCVCGWLLFVRSSGLDTIYAAGVQTAVKTQQPTFTSCR